MKVGRHEALGVPTLGRWALAIAAWQLAFLACAVLAPRVLVPPMAAYVFAFGAVVAGALTVATATPRPTRPSLVAGVIALAALALPTLGGMSAGIAPALVVAGALLALGSLVGTFVGARIEHPGHLLFVAIVSAFADTFSVTQPEGPSAAIVSSEAALSLLAVSFPMLGTPQIEPLLGVGDIVFTSLYVAASRAHALPLRRSLFALSMAFLVTMLVVIATELPIPALPFMSVAILIAQPAARVPARQDRRRGLLVLAGFVAFFLALLARRWF